MKFSRLVAFLKYYWQFIPFRFNFILFIAILFVAKKWLLTSNAETSSFTGVTLLMAKVALIFTVVIAGISFLSSCFCFLYFLYQKRNKGTNSLALKMDLESFKDNILRIQTKLPFALKPILGFVKMRLVYDQTKYTDQFILGERLQQQFFAFNTGLTGTNALLLPDIKEYYFSNAIISFEDMLQLFSFTANAKVNATICNLPHSLLLDTHELPPKKTIEEKVRIDQLRKVEGELLNYRKFEDSDDVRRIVWKIFAKNKELVVRVPEIMDPFASHIFMYASFFNQQNLALHEAYQLEMCNHFKNCVWTIYDALTKKAFEIRFIFDQQIINPNPEIDPVKYSIALSNWHQEQNLINYFKPKSGSVLCLHSFSSAQQVAEILSGCDANTNIFFIQLSKIFKSHYLLNWLMRIFFKPTSDRLTALRNKWAIHPLKFQTLNNEKVLLSLLKKHDINLEII